MASIERLLVVVIPETLSCLVNNVGPVTVVIPAKVASPVTLIFVKEILSSRLTVIELPEPTEVRLVPPEIVKVSLRRSISTVPESPAIVSAVPTTAVDTAVTNPLALTVTIGIRVCDPNVPTLLLTVASVVTVLTEVISPVKFGILVVVVAVPALPSSAPINVVAVMTPETLNCLANNVAPVTVVIQANVANPTTLSFSPILTLSS